MPEPIEKRKLIIERHKTAVELALFVKKVLRLTFRILKVFFFTKNKMDDITKIQSQACEMCQLPVEVASAKHKTLERSIYALSKEDWDVNFCRFVYAKKVMYESIFQQLIDRVHISQSKDTKVLRIEGKIRELGVQVSCIDDLAFAEAIYSVCRSANKFGVKLPKEILLVDFKNPYSLGCMPCTAEDPEDNKIMLQRIIRPCPYDTTFLFNGHSMREFTDSTLEGTLWHELGHYNHLLKIKGHLSKLEETFVKITFNEQNYFRIISEVSCCARKSPFDFVAEVFSGLATGERYSDFIMSVYEVLHGPKFSTF